MNAIVDHLRQYLNPRITIHDGTPTDGAGPWIAVHGGSADPANRRYGYTARTGRVVWQCVCVSNTQEGARQIARLAASTLDAAPLAEALLTVTYVSSPIEDRDDPSEWRWSSTVEVVHHVTI